MRYDHHLPSWPGDDWHSVALAPELISSSATAMDGPALVTLPAPPRSQSVPAYTGPRLSSRGYRHDISPSQRPSSRRGGYSRSRPASLRISPGEPPIRHTSLDSRRL